MTDVINVLSPLVTVQDANGDPVANGSIEFYVAGTSTPKTVYADRDLTTALGTTVATDSAGYPVTGGGARTLIYTGVGDFKMIVKNSLGATIVTHDNVPGAVAIPTSAEFALPQTPVISKTSTYSVVPADRGKVINANPTSGSFAITLLSAVAAGDGFRITIRHAANSTNVVTIRTTGLDVIGIPGKYTTSFALKGFGAAVTLVCDGAGWIVDSEVPPAVLDGIPYLKITDRLTTPPASPVGGARYIINGSPTGAWSTLGFAANQIAESDGNGSWFAYTPDRGWFAYVADENVFTVWNGAAWADQLGMTTPSSSTIQSAVFEQQYPNGSGGGSATTGAWTKRTLDVTVKNTISGCSLSSGQIVLPVGTHFIFASQESYLVAQFQSRIAVVSGSATPTVIKSGASNLRVNDSGGDTPSVYDYGPVIAGIVTVTATATIELQYWAQTTAGGTSALGFPSAEPDGTNEVYARVTVISLSALQGPVGPGGPQGTDGIDAGYAYAWSTLTSGDPGSGKIAGNSGTISSISQLQVSETDANGVSLAAIIATWDDSTSSTKARITITKEGTSGGANKHIFSLTGAGTDQGSYWTFPVTYVSTAGTISNGDSVAVLVLEKGDKGDTGATDDVASPNLLINGDFKINQRQFGGGTLASSAYGFDRWRAASGGCSISVSGYVVSLASGGIEQYIEPSMMGVASLASTQITISVEDPSQNMSVVVGSVGDTITAGSGRRSTTITTEAGDTGNLRVYLARASGSGVTFGRVKAEIGASATAWRPRPREVEMALCRRYFQTTYPDGMPGGSATSAGTMQCIVSLSVTTQGIRWPFGPMRAAPTLTIWNVAGTLGQGSSFNGNGPKALTPSSISTQGVWYFGGSGMSVGDFYDIHFHASAEF